MGDRVDYPRVTVIAACFNHERFVEECLDSIVQQGYPNLQLIITDDRSTDSSPALIERWIDRAAIGAIFIHQDRNRGLPATLNKARSFADGTYVTVIATDDLMEPGRLHTQIKQFEALPQRFAALYSDANVIDEAGVLAPQTIAQRSWWFDRPPEGQILRDLLRINFIPAPSVIMRRACLDAAGPYDENLLFEDWDMWLRLSEVFEFKYSPFIGVRYRLVETSLYHTRRKQLAESKVAMLQKWLDHPIHRAIVINRLRNEVHHLYDLDRVAALPHLKHLCQLQPGWPSQGRYLLARVGMTYRTQQRLVDHLRRLR